MRTAIIRLRIVVALMATIPALSIVNRAAAQGFSEPATVFYGKVIGTGSVQDFLITEGALAWTILRSDGVEVTYETELFELKDGTLSYRLDVPHSAFALGLDPDDHGIPMPPVAQTHVHRLIRVDGTVAEILGPASGAFTTEQLLRTSTYRLDLGVDREAVDSDGDGIPDWWEDAHGLNKQVPSDAIVDLTGDGLSALDAYLRGLDPNVDARTPVVLTDEMLVYEHGATAVILDAIDLNSAPSQLVYTVTSTPLAGSLVLRNALEAPSGPDRTLVLGDTFSQQDVLRSRIVYQHDGVSAEAGSFDVELRDEVAEHEAVGATVQLLLFQQSENVAADLSWRERMRLENAWYCSRGYVIADASELSEASTVETPSSGLTAAALAEHVAQYGDARRHVLIDNRGRHALVGGGAYDVLVSGSGDGDLLGGEGRDSFVFTRFEEGHSEVKDFVLGQSDKIDLSALAEGRSGYVQDYVRIVDEAGHARIEVDSDGGGDSFTNLSVSVVGLSSAAADLYALVASGHLNIGKLELEPRIIVSATVPQASENGPTAAEFTLVRSGSLSAEVVVNVTMSGSAVNGVDYLTIPSSIVIPSGASSATVALVPYGDSSSEQSESATLGISSGDGYALGAAVYATATIEDLLMLVEVEALTSVAVKETGASGLFMVSRRDVVDRDALIRLTIGGTAENGSDYDSIIAFVAFGVNETFKLIAVAPKASAVLSGGMETVVLTVEPDASYRVVADNDARVSIVERLDSLADWREREFPADAQELAAFAGSDSGSIGITQLERYAFGLDPLSPGKDGLPTPVILDGSFHVSFRRPVAVTDVAYHVRGCSDLGDWEGASLAVVEVDPPAGTTDPQLVFYRIESGGGSKGFIEVRTEWLP